MSYDYFLIHRVLQIQRLRAEGTQQYIEIPGRFARDGLSPPVVGLLRDIDRICKLPFGDARGGVMQFLQGLRRGKHEQGLTARQRDLIFGFESQLVHVRLSDDPHGARLAAHIIAAILDDRGFFYGLKPIAEHDRNFAYEFLYPTTLNLYTAMRLRLPDASKAKFSDDEIRAVIGGLSGRAAGKRNAWPPLIALLTFAAHRYPAAEALDLIHRLLELCSQVDAHVLPSCVEALTTLQSYCPTAAEFQELMRAYIIVECALCRVAQPRPRPENSSCGAFPATVQKQLRLLPEDPQSFSTYQQLVKAVGMIVLRADGFDRDFGQLFSTGEHDVLELLNLCFSAAAGRPAFSCKAQAVVARTIDRSKAAGSAELRDLRAFAHHLAPRLDVLDDEMLARFAAEFIDQDRNRAVLLKCSASQQLRQQITDKLTAAARAAEDVDQFFYRLLIVAMIGTTHDVAALESIQRSVNVLKIARRDESISPRELSDLVADIRAHLPASLKYLESPAFAGRGKSERLGKMYLALNEACHLYAATGRIGNFGLTRAAYRNLDRLAKDDV